MSKKWGADADDLELARDGGVPSSIWKQLVEAVGKNTKRSTRIAVMGQTGVGKSTVINALFGSKLQTGAVRPTTTERAEVKAELGGGRSLVFVDLPGIGESLEADTRYVDMYMDELHEADIALWLFSAESRSLRADMEFLRNMGVLEQNRELILRKVNFGLTKADLVAAPWILCHDGVHASFAIPEEEGTVLRDKAAFVRESATESLGSDAHSVTITSARFRYGLAELLMNVLRSADDATVARLGPVVDAESLSSLSLFAALSFRNFTALNTNTKERIDIANQIGVNRL